ncbi:hypothetical protein ABVT39_014335 [Epinephelus coioides]
MASRSRASAAVETKSSLARTGPPGGDGGPVEGPGAASGGSEAMAERHTGGRRATRAPGHPVPEDCPPLSRRTRGDNEFARMRTQACDTVISLRLWSLWSRRKPFSHI